MIALGTALLALGVGVVVTSPQVIAEATVGPRRFVNPARPIDANNSPSVARNPRDSRTLAVTHRVDRPRFSAGLLRSDDDGATWRPLALPLPDGLDRPFAPDIAFGPDGTLYVVYVNLEGPGNSPANLWVARAAPGSDRLDPPVRVAGRLAFQARIAVDRRGAVHLTWLAATEVGILRLSGPSAVVSARSTNGGRSWTTPVQVSDNERQHVGAATPVIDGRGRLVVLYTDFGDDRRDFENLEGPPWDRPFHLVVTSSTDGGRTFALGAEVEPDLVPAKRFIVFLPEFPSIAAGRDDDLVVTWADGRNEDEDVFVRRSGDGGRTWSDAVQVNDEPLGDGTAQFLPKVAVAPDGRMDVVYFDRRRGGKGLDTDVNLASSTDGGRSFENRRLTPQPFDGGVGPELGRRFGVDFGTRLGLVSSDGDAFAVWTDSTLGDDSTGRQDIASALVQFTSRRGGLRPFPGAAAIAIGVGMMLIGLAPPKGGVGRRTAIASGASGTLGD